MLKTKIALWSLAIALMLNLSSAWGADDQETLADGRYLLVAVPDPSSGSVPVEREKGILVFDIDNNFQLVRRYEMPQVEKGFRGLCADAASGRMYASHSEHSITSLEVLTGKTLWQQRYDIGCDRPDLTPDGKHLYVPTGWWQEGKESSWKVVDADNGNVVNEIPVGKGGAHNTLCGRSGQYAFLAAINHNYLTVADTSTQKVVRRIGPLSGGVWPFCIDGASRRAYINVGYFIGFDIADVATGKLLTTVRVAGKEDESRRVHGIGLSPDESELWFTDSAADEPKIYIFDNTKFPPKLKDSFTPSRKSHGWVCFSRDGKIMFNDTGEMIDVASRTAICELRTDREVLIGSSKFVEVHVHDGKTVWCGKQIAQGRMDSQESNP